jgi:hypothetical protein
MYLKLTPEFEKMQLYLFTIQSDSSSFELAYDFSNCNERTSVVERPNKDDGYCQLFTQTKHVEFADYDGTGTIFIGIKLVGNATVKVTTKDDIKLTGEGGAIKTLFTDNYQPYEYIADDVGYILVKTTTKMANNDIQLYHNTHECKKDNTFYPRQSHYCMKSNSKGNTSLIIPSTLGTGQIHRFGVQIGVLDRVEFKYDFIPITELAVNNKSQYEFDNTITTPFQVIVKTGGYIVTVQSTATNECNIYADYDGCNYGLNKLPNKRNYCLSSTFNKSQGSCDLEINIDDENAVVYFGVETAAKQDMSVAVYSMSKLTFLE